MSTCHPFCNHIILVAQIPCLHLPSGQDAAVCKCCQPLTRTFSFLNHSPTKSGLAVAWLAVSATEQTAWRKHKQDTGDSFCFLSPTKARLDPSPTWLQPRVNSWTHLEEQQPHFRMSAHWSDIIDRFGSHSRCRPCTSPWGAASKSVKQTQRSGKTPLSTHIDYLGLLSTGKYWYSLLEKTPSFQKLFAQRHLKMTKKFWQKSKHFFTTATLFHFRYALRRWSPFGVSNWMVSSLKRSKWHTQTLPKGFNSSYFLNKNLIIIMHSMQYFNVNEINNFPIKIILFSFS